MLWLIPMEPLEQRYTQMIHELIVEQARQETLPLGIITGEQSYEEIESGAFLDMIKSCQWKCDQLSGIAQLFENDTICDGDKFFFYELWYPGIEQVRIMAMAANKHIEIYGMLHGGTWMDSDYMKGLPQEITNSCQASFIACADKVFLGSRYHMDMINRWKNIMERHWSDDKLIVTRLPFSSEWVWDKAGHQYIHRQKVLLFPLRPHIEKGVQEFIALGRRLLAEDQEAEVWFSCGGFQPEDIDDNKTFTQYHLMKQEFPRRVRWLDGIPKSKFYETLKTATVMFSGCIQESFGYSIIEGATLGCVPVCPRSTCYPEMLPDKFLYEPHNLDAAYELIVHWLNTGLDRAIEVYDGEVNNGFGKMLKEMDV